MTAKPTETTSSKPPSDAGAAALPMLLWAGMCNAWECDTLSHMNVRFYINRVHQSWAMFAALIKLPHAFHVESASTLLPQEIYARFHREVRSGDFLVMTGGVVSVDETTLVLYQELRKSTATGELAATFRVVLQHVESKRGKPFAWSAKALATMQHLMIPALPEAAAPRSLSLEPVQISASRARAKQLSVPLAGLTTLQAFECDNFGRMRPEFALGRQSDSGGGFPTIWHEATELAGFGSRFSGVVMETRLVFRTWPRAGDILEVRGGITAASPKSLRFVVWTLDPVSGECWTSSDNVMVHFDLETRRAFTPGPEIQQIFERRAIKGLSP